MKKDIKNVAASVRQRLLNRAKETNRPFDEVLQYYAMERFLYRLGQSDYGGSVILKGALMFIVWNAPRSRATRDIDLLGHLENSVDNIVGMVKEICQIQFDLDGILFSPESVDGGRIKEDAEYEGVRVTFRGRLEQARVNMQIDFGFGDTVFPHPKLIEYPTIFDMPRPQLKGYPRETVAAEKFEAMIDRGLLNSRMKDFYDLCLLANHFDFDGHIFAKALQETFTHRGTALTVNSVALSDEFYNNPEKKTQWSAFIRKGHLDHAPKELKDVIMVIRAFLQPVVTALLKKKSFDFSWKAPGPWQA